MAAVSGAKPTTPPPSKPASKPAEKPAAQSTAPKAETKPAAQSTTPKAEAKPAAKPAETTKSTAAAKPAETPKSSPAPKSDNKNATNAGGADSTPPANSTKGADALANQNKAGIAMQQNKTATGGKTNNANPNAPGQSINATPATGPNSKATPAEPSKPAQNASNAGAATEGAGAAPAAKGAAPAVETTQSIMDKYIKAVGGSGNFTGDYQPPAKTLGFSNQDEESNDFYQDKNGNKALDTGETVNRTQMQGMAGADLVFTGDEANANQISVFNQGTQQSGNFAESGITSVDFNQPPPSKFGSTSSGPLTKVNMADGQTHYAWDGMPSTTPLGSTPVNETRTDGSGGGMVGGNANDTFVVSGAGTGGGGVVTYAGNDNVTIDGKTGGVNLGKGDDTLAVGHNIDSGGISGGTGNDTLILTGGQPSWTVEQKSGGYSVTSNVNGNQQYYSSFENLTYA